MNLDVRTRYNKTAIAQISLPKNCNKGVKLGIISELGGNNRSNRILLTNYEPGGDHLERPKVTIHEMRAQVFSEARRLGFGEATLWRHWLPGIYLRSKKKVSIYSSSCSSPFMETHQSDASLSAWNAISQWLGHGNVETTLVYACADIEHKRMAITRELEEDAAPAIKQSNYTITDKELLRQLYGL